MAIANKILPYYTYEDWLHWEGKWELIEGIPFAMSPTPIPRHQRVAAEISAEFILALRKSNCNKCRVFQPLDYKISDDTILVPDILIICGPVTKKYLDFPPSLIVEILSPSTALKDRNTKFEIYQSQGVKYYLIIDASKNEIEIFDLVNHKYELLPQTFTPEFSLTNDCSIKPDLQNVFE
jgi:Uma2 family endonuclease